MGAEEPPAVWEDRKIRKNGKGGYHVNIPKTWVQAMNRPASEVLNQRIIFELKDGKFIMKLVE